MVNENLSEWSGAGDALGKSKLFLFAALSLAVLAPSVGLASTYPSATYRWTDRVDNKWSTVGNWEMAATPVDWSKTWEMPTAWTPCDAVPTATSIEVVVDATKGVLDIDPEDGVKVWRILPMLRNTVVIGHALTLTGWDWTGVSRGINDPVSGNWSSGTILAFRVPVSFTQAKKTGYGGISWRGCVSFLKPVTGVCDSWFTVNSPGIVFYDTVTAPTLLFSDPSGSTALTFVKPAELMTIRWGTYNSSPVVIGSAGNAVANVRVSDDKADIQLGAENAFTANTYLIQERIGASAGVGSINLCNHHQVMNRVTGTGSCSADAWSIRSHVNKAAAPTVLTLRGSQDACTTFRVQDQISIVWDPTDDFVQSFSNRVNATRGSVTVKRGTFRVAGTATFPNLTSVDVKSGATFDLASTAAGALANVRHLFVAGRFAVGADATTPFSGGVTVAKIAAGGKIVVGAGQTVTLAGVEYGGAYLADDSYSGEDWIEGAGTVVIDSAKVAIWKAATGGSWGTAANWVGGAVPTTAQNVYLELDSAADYTVCVSSATALPNQVDVFNRGGGTAKLSLGAAVTHDNGRLYVGRGGFVEVAAGASLTASLAGMATSTTTIDNPVQVVDGGVYRIAGDVGYSNFVGCFGIGGQGAETGRLEMVSGSLAFAAKDANHDNALTVADYGRVLLSGGTMTVKGDNANPVIKLCGGEFRTEGTAVVANDGTSALMISRLGGRFAMAGSSVWPLDNRAWPNMTPKYVTPAHAGGCVEYDFRDQSSWSGISYTHLQVATLPGSVAKMSFGSTGFPFNPDSGMLAGSLRVGYGGKRAEAEFSAGAYRFQDYGFFVGNVSPGTVSAETEGILRLSGGVIRNRGGGTGYSQKEMLGFCVGQYLSPIRLPGRYVTGLVDMSGGAVTNTGNSILVGTGFATGTWNQSAGVVYNESDFIVGAAHGAGVYELSGGKVTSLKSLFVGGVETNLLAGGTFGTGVVSSGWPIDLHDAEGTLRIKGGSLTAATYGGNWLKTFVGLDGKGTIEMVGTAGTLELGDLFLTNNVAAAAGETGACLAYKFGATGVSPIDCYGAVQIAAGTKVRLDFTDYAGAESRIPLIRLRTSGKSIVGTVAPADVETVGLPKNRRCVLEQTATSFRARLKPIGFAVFMR